MVEQKTLSFRDERVKEALLEWWRELEDRRGHRAELRRCRSPVEVFFRPAFHHLRAAMKPLGRVNDARLAAVAGVLAHVKENDPGPSFGARMGEPKAGSAQRAAVSDLRFRRLIENQTREELYPALVRILRLLGGSADLVRLAGDVYYWGPNVRKQWAFDYYERAPEPKKTS